MMETIDRHPRAGWQQDEIDFLFQSVKEASELGKPLRNVFADVANRLSRKPNSIRNYYYARIRETPELAPGHTPFRAFGKDELYELLRSVLIGRGQGESVRSCVTRLADGDRSGMLRYQNKYRSVLKSKPDMLLQIADELRAEGLPCPEDVLCARRRCASREPAGSSAQMLLESADDPCVRRILDGLCELLKRDSEPVRTESGDSEELQAVRGKLFDYQREADRLKVEVDILRLALEDALDGKIDSGFIAEAMERGKCAEAD